MLNVTLAMLVINIAKMTCFFFTERYFCRCTLMMDVLFFLGSDTNPHRDVKVYCVCLCRFSA